MDILKNILKLAVGLLAGILIGLTFAGVGVVLFTDRTAAQFISSLGGADMLEVIYAAVAGVMFFLISLSVIIITHEAGHLMCGLMSGYRFVSFRIFNYTILRSNGHFRLKRFAVAGTGGQCLLDPPDRPVENIPVFWYNAGGVLANLLLLIIAAVLFPLVSHPMMVEFLVIFMLTDFILILINGIPLKMGGAGNDAYNMLHLRNDHAAKRAIMLQLHANALIQEGIRPKDMPDRWFEWPEHTDWRNSLEVSMPLMHASRLVDRMEWEKAYGEFEEMYSHKDEIVSLYVYEISCELAFCAMITGRLDRAMSLLDKELMNYVNQYAGVMSSKQRLLCGKALMMDHDRDKAMSIYDRLLTTKDTYLLQGEVKSDLDIMERMLL